MTSLPGRLHAALGALILCFLALSSVGATRASPVAPSTSPIRHVVVIYQENHSFDNVLGKLCANATAGITKRAPCDGATTGVLPDNSTIPLSKPNDIVPNVWHDITSQQTAINGGAMNGFGNVHGCQSTSQIPYACYSQYQPYQIPNLSALAVTFTISDRTFEFRTTPSWMGHMVLASATTDGFWSNNPLPSSYTTARGPGWGCDSYRDASWMGSSGLESVPSCIPDRSGAGPYRPSPVPYVPTIFDRLHQAGLSWRIYGGDGTLQTGPTTGYVFTICPTFYECIGSRQVRNLLPARRVLGAATNGTLPSYSVVTPVGVNSQHNSESMRRGDNWIGQVVSAIMNGPQWSSTAIFITFDDCGCFYDHVPPPTPNAGIRVPMVIVSPYAKAGYTDSNRASYVSILAYVEHTFGLQPLSSEDAAAYDYSGSFDYSKAPAPPIALTRTPIPLRERRWIQAHPMTINEVT